jgi:hypothetical protein
MNDKKDYLQKFIEEFLVPKIGWKPFQNIKDIRNRRKISNAIIESFENDKLKINLSEEISNELKEKLLEKFKIERDENVE